MRRRSFLEALVYLSVSSKMLATARAAPAGKARRFVDVHCHFFNAADLPVKGFLERVALADYTLASSSSASLGSPSVWHGMAAKLADLIVKERAPTPRQELDCLSGLACANFSASPAVATRSLRQPGDRDRLAQNKLLGEILQSHYDKPETRSLERAPERRGDGDVDAFVDFVLKEMQSQGQAPQISTRSLRSIGPSSSRGVLQSVAEFVTSGHSIFSRYFNWAKVLTDYRANIAATYQSLYDPSKSRIILATPALVDYNFWLDDQSPSPISDQIELMGRFSLRSSFPMHGFAPFDPLREVRRADTPTSLEIVQDAVYKHGFLGAKLYSPMGFRPSRNAELGFRFPASAADIDHKIGKQLDDALNSLYAWCQKEDAAILAHTTDSQSAGPEFASRADPQFWLGVLEKYPALRLNLAHFGNFSQAFVPNSAADPTTRFAQTWEYEIGALVKSGRFPNVYADISYFYWVLEGSADEKKKKAAKAMFKQYFDMFDPHVERLMFGTDWNMTGKADGFGDYIGNVEGFFRDAGLSEAQLDNLFYKNALKFLGLKGATKTTARLKAFYATAKRPYPRFV